MFTLGAQVLCPGTILSWVPMWTHLFLSPQSQNSGSVPVLKYCSRTKLSTGSLREHVFIGSLALYSQFCNSEHGLGLLSVNIFSDWVPCVWTQQPVWTLPSPVNVGTFILTWITGLTPGLDRSKGTEACTAGSANDGLSMSWSSNPAKMLHLITQGPISEWKCCTESCFPKP